MVVGAVLGLGLSALICSDMHSSEHDQLVCVLASDHICGCLSGSLRRSLASCATDNHVQSRALHNWIAVCCDAKHSAFKAFDMAAICLCFAHVAKVLMILNILEASHASFSASSMLSVASVSVSINPTVYACLYQCSSSCHPHFWRQKQTILSLPVSNCKQIWLSSSQPDTTHTHLWLLLGLAASSFRALVRVLVLFSRLRSCCISLSSFAIPCTPEVRLQCQTVMLCRPMPSTALQNLHHLMIIRHTSKDDDTFNQISVMCWQAATAHK